MAKGKGSRKSTIPVSRTGTSAPDKGGQPAANNTTVKRIPRHQGR